MLQFNLDAAQMALMAVDTSPGMNYLFAPSTTSDNTVRTSRGDERNVEGQLLYQLSEFGNYRLITEIEYLTLWLKRTVFDNEVST